MAEPNQFDFSDFLETQPQALYQSFLSDPSARMPSSMKRYYQNQFSTIQNEYIGELARSMRQGNLPTRTFSDYLQKDVFQSPTRRADERTGYGPSGFETELTQQGSPMRQFSGYDRFRRESPYARSAYGAGPMSRNMFAPSARWITY